jgi:hypothetical protein
MWLTNLPKIFNRFRPVVVVVKPPEAPPVTPPPPVVPQVDLSIPKEYPIVRRFIAEVSAGFKKPTEIIYRNVTNPEILLRWAKLKRSKTRFGAIPKIIHQVWIGNFSRAYCEWMDSFRLKYLNAHPNWEYKIWNLEIFENKYGRMINRDYYEIETVVASKADLLRYEILYREGGVYIDADSIWLERSLDPYLAAAKRTGLFLGLHSGDETVSFQNYTLFANGVIGVSKRHPAMEHIIYAMGVNYADLRMRQMAPFFVTTGPFYFSYALQSVGFDITAVATNAFFPMGWHRDYGRFNLSTLIAVTREQFPKSAMFQIGMNTQAVRGYHAIQGDSLDACVPWAANISEWVKTQ